MEGKNMPAYFFKSIMLHSLLIFKVLYSAWFLFLFIILSPFSSQAASGGGWKFDWSDEFSGPSIDAAVWGYETGYVRNSEDQYYTNRTENSRIDSGNLLIQARRDNWNGHEYTSASRRSMGKKFWLYGRFEMRAKIDIRQGSWPAWWWLPNSGGWPAGGEIDMMEFYRGDCLFNVMDGKQIWSSKIKSTASLGGSRWANQFHVWTWEWDSSKIDISLDGTLMNHYAVGNADGTGPGGANPFRRPGYMLVNQAIGGTNGGDPSKTAFPVEYRVDWIRRHVWSTEAAFDLTVTGGVGSGPYVANTLVSITAKMPQTDQVFDKWIVNAGSPSIDSITNPSARLTMPASDVAVIATYKMGSSVMQPLTIKTISSKKHMTVFNILGRKMKLPGYEVSRHSCLPAGVYIVTRANHPPALMGIPPSEGF